MKTAQRLAFATAILTVFLIAVGVFVRATGSGLGCSNWPTCEGSIVPPTRLHALIEMSHRVTATVVGLFVVATAVAAFRAYRHVPIITWLAVVTIPLVGFQGILGAITVKRELPPEIVATHLVVAMVVLACELAVAWMMFLEDPDRSTRWVSRGTRLAARPSGLVAIAGLGWLGVTMWVGGYMAESGASTACSGWPACNGSVLPGAGGQEITHMLHRYLAGLLVFFIAAFVLFLWRRRAALPWARSLAIAITVVYVAQVFVGAFNVWYTFPDWLTVTHTLLASLVWFGFASGAVLSCYRASGERVAALSGRELPA